MEPPSALQRLKYKGETVFPMVLSNLHRFALYTAIVNVAFLLVDVVVSLYTLGHLYIGVGTLLLGLNVVMLSAYTVDGVPISETDFAGMIERLRPVVDSVAADHGQATEFEMLTAAAIRHLRDREIDYLVCEVGMGGRLDSTNVLDLGVKVITNVELDHMQYLGATVLEIAAEKAGIIRAGDIVVTGRLSDDTDA